LIGHDGLDWKNRFDSGAQERIVNYKATKLPFDGFALGRNSHGRTGRTTSIEANPRRVGARRRQEASQFDCGAMDLGSRHPSSLTAVASFIASRKVTACHE